MAGKAGHRASKHTIKHAVFLAAAESSWEEPGRVRVRTPDNVCVRDLGPGSQPARPYLLIQQLALAQISRYVEVVFKRRRGGGCRRLRIRGRSHGSRLGRSFRKESARRQSFD